MMRPLKHYTHHPKQAYVSWIKRYLYFHGRRHPSAMNAPEVESHRANLAVPAMPS